MKAAFSPFSFFGMPFSISSGLWLLTGFIRAIFELFDKSKSKNKKTKYNTSDIAVIIPAHNEELVITDCIKALKQSFKKKQIYVASDGSADKTYTQAWTQRVNVLAINPGVGKAKAIVRLINRYNLFKKYKFIFIVDADTKIDKNFAKNALKLFEDRQIKVVFCTARIHWPSHILPKLGLYFVAYRERLNRMLQFFFIYGQTWKYTNVPYVIPGFATIYRSQTLKKLEIDTPGLLIEDFNLAFQFHKKRLGKIGYSPALIGWDQHPDNLVDYWKQVRRWNIGFFQTVKKNGVWPSFFWLSLGLFMLEVTLHSIFLLFVPLLVLYWLFPLFPANLNLSIYDGFVNLYSQIGPFKNVSLVSILTTIFWYDYGMTVVFGLMGRKPQFIFYGLFFFIMHFITSLILLSSIIPGFFGRSEGRWISPKRYAVKSVAV